MAITGVGDESSDDDEGEAERECPWPGSRSSSVLEDASYSVRIASAPWQAFSPPSGNIQVEDAVPYGALLSEMDTGISSSGQLLQKPSTHAIQDSMVEPRQSQRSEPACDQGKRPRSGNALLVPNSSKANIHRSETEVMEVMTIATAMTMAMRVAIGA